MSDSKSKSNDADWGFAGFDFAKLIESCQISGVDMMALDRHGEEEHRRAHRGQPFGI